ncbi:MAG: response regulator [Chlamydiae bacterium]|nr:response regulator [Chlamydiota bacterium]
MNTIVYKNYPVLVVDDEAINLKSYLRALKDDFEVEGANSAQEALEKLKTKKYSVVVSDQKMYPITGVELLTQVREQYPNIVRIIITGFSNFEAAVKAINDADAFKFIFKTGSVAQDLRKVVKEAIDYLWDREERKRLQSLLIRENRLMSLGRLVGALSHEINNPLSAINTMLQFLKENPNNREAVEKTYEIGLSEIDHLRKIISRIGKFSDADSLTKSDVAVTNIVSEAAALFKEAEESKKIKINRQGIQQYHTIHANGYLVMQVILNLLLNSAQAIKDTTPGNVEIATEKEPIILKDREGKDAQYVRLTLKDNGPGIKKEILKNIFEPFVTSRDAGGERRAGLGLFISQHVIEGNHGYIGIQSKEREGTTVTIDLPIA